MLGSKFQILTVLSCQGRNTQASIWQVDAFFRAKFGRAVGGMRDLDFKPAFAPLLVDFANDAADLAVIKEDALPGPGTGENLEKRASDLGGLINDVFIVDGGLSEDPFRRQHEVIANT